jgi:hypothetical protein
MAQRDNTNTPDTPQGSDAEVALINDHKLLEQFAEMATAIPADLGGGTEDIVAKILSATTWDQLDEPWETSAIDDILGLTLHVTKVTRRPSTYQGGLGVFLVVHLTDTKTGKEYVKTTGAISVVAQLVRAYFMGVTALTIQWVRAERPSANGYYPQHLKVVDAAMPVKGSV